jgi:tetratricopeptide (TPR) repeat protein
MPSGVWPKAVPLLILAALLAYANCVNKTLVFDDDAWLSDRPALNDPLTYFQEMDGRPLLAATNLALHRVGRNNPLAHHVLNVLIHIAAGLTLYGLVRRTLLLPRFHKRYADRAPYLAFAAALLWLVHPLQVQCVTYIIQRGESMAGLFYLLMLYALLRGNAPDSRRFLWYTLAVASLVLGFASKEIMATAPVAVLLYDRIFLTKSIGRMVRRRWIFYLVFLSVWAAFVAWHMSRAVEAQGGIGFQMETLTPKKYALTQAGVILYYLRISFWPRGLAIDYQSWPWTETLADAMPEAAIVGGMLLATAVLLVWRPALGFVCAWFFIILAPTSSVLPIVDPVFEHRMYLSLASVTILAVFAGDWLLRALSLGWARPFALAVVALALGVLTHLRNEEYESRATVWDVAVKRMPDSVRARANYAQGLMADDRAPEVPPMLERALEFSSTDATALQNMAAAHEMLQEFHQSVEYYRRLTVYYPANADYWRMYAATLLVLGRYPEAADAYQEAGVQNPELAEAYFGRAAALFELSEDADAEREVARATKIDPDWPEGVLGRARGVMLDEKLRAHPLASKSALVWARLAIRYLDKPRATHLDTLGLCYAANGDFAKAAEQSRWSLLLVPDGPWGSLHRDRLRDYQRQRLPWDN